MSKDWVKDINDMHAKFGVHDWVKLKSKNYLMIYIYK